MSDVKILEKVVAGSLIVLTVIILLLHGLITDIGRKVYSLKIEEISSLENIQLQHEKVQELERKILELELELIELKKISEDADARSREVQEALEAVCWNHNICN